MNRQLTLLVFITSIASIAAWFPSRLNAAPTNEARVTRVKNHVQIGDSKNAARGASVNDIVREETLLRTGTESRAELTFSDETVVRLAAHTAFDFDRGTHCLNLKDGAVLVQAPREARGATIHAGDVAAAVAGTTVMIEYHPGVYKFLVLEGTGRLYRPGHVGDSVLVAPGQMVFGNPEAAVSDPVDVDIARFMQTSGFIKDFPPLRSEKSIVAETRKQQHEKSNKTLRDTNLVIFGGGTQVSAISQEQTDMAVRTSTDLLAPRRVSSANRNTAPALP
ncbi:MAG TPA: FecR domain-containing protein [Candidatus Udaeobacter sp.]|nr:FecR domain-containing protein [Candidatus Udaeobacter sp.]